MLYNNGIETKKGPMENRLPQFYTSLWDTTKTQEKNRTKLRKADTNSSKFTFFASVKSKAIMINI